MGNFYLKNKSLILEILRFLLVGGLATVVDFLAYDICRFFIFKSISPDVNLTISTAIGFIFGNIVNYILSIVFVFKGAKEDKSTQTFKAFLIFTIIGVLGLGIKIGLQHLGNAFFHSLLANSEGFINWLIDTFIYAIATFVVLIWNYVGRKILIFKGENK